jgi:hypothetical protein
MCRKLKRPRARKTDHCGLGAHLMGVAGPAFDTDDRGNVNDAAQFTTLYAWHNCLCQKEGRAHINGDHLVKMILRHLFDSLNATHPGIVDEDIVAAIVSLEAFEGRYHGVEIGDVADERFCQTAVIDNFFCAVSSAKFCRRSWTTTKAPRPASAFASAWPIPFPAPVTTAIRPRSYSFSVTGLPAVWSIIRQFRAVAILTMPGAADKILAEILV